MKKILIIEDYILEIYLMEEVLKNNRIIRNIGEFKLDKQYGCDIINLVPVLWSSGQDVTLSR